MSSEISICEICGRKDLQDHTKCEKHEFVLCDKCSITIGNRIFCLNEAREMIPISRDQFKILVAVGNEIVDADDIAKVTDIPFDKVPGLVQILLENNLLIKNQEELIVSKNGEVAFKVYSQFFGDEEEMDKLDEEVIRFVSSR